MQVGIMSMQRIKNYGSFLQAYSLKKNIEALGGTVQFVDYQVGAVISAPAAGKAPVSRSILKAVFGKIRRRLGIYTKSEKLFLKRKAFNQRYPKEFFSILGLTESPNYTPSVDLLVIGSDEVFNCLQTNHDVGFSKQLFGAENKAKTVITYAASFGNTTLERLNAHGLTKEVGQYLSALDRISARDENTQAIVTALTGNKPELHLDPVFIYDYPEVDTYPITLTDYIVVYAYTNRLSPAEGEAIQAYARKLGKQIVCLGEYQSFCDLYIPADPFEMLSYIKHADYVISDTFHGTVFSIKYHKQFTTIVRDSATFGYGNAEKLTSLLDKFGLTHRILRDMSDLGQILPKTIDYTNADRILEEEAQRSRHYLAQYVCCEDNTQ